MCRCVALLSAGTRGFSDAPSVRKLSPLEQVAVQAQRSILALVRVCVHV